MVSLQSSGVFLTQLNQNRASNLHHRTRGIFDTKEYYDHVFEQLGAGEILEWYKSDWTNIAPAIDSHLHSALRNVSVRRVLDLGCGTSRLAAQIAVSFAGVRLIVGTDVSPLAIEAQKAAYHVLDAHKLHPGSPRLRYVVADVTKSLPFRTSSFPVIIEKAFIDALCSTSRGTAKVDPMLSEVSRLLLPGGVFVSISQSAECRSSLLTKRIPETKLALLEKVFIPDRNLCCYVMQRCVP